MHTDLTASQPSVGEQHDVAVKQLGQWTLVWRRFRQHRLALVGGWILLAIVALAVVGPFFAPPLSTEQFVQEINHGKPPLLWPLSLTRIMGTDTNDNPVSRFVLVGGQPLLIIGFLGAFIASLVGIIIGSIAGYFGKFVDTILMRITDTFLTIPFLPLLFLLGFYLPDQSVLTYAVLFGIVGWGGVARLVRSYLLSLRQREYAEAARALGVSDIGVIIRHLLPNTLDIMIVSFTLNVAIFIITVASLQFISGNIGVVGGAVSAFGQGLSATTWVSGIDVNYEDQNWWTLVFPGICLLLTVLSINFVGDGLRDAFDTTSTGALIRWKDRPDRERASGIRRLALTGTRQIARPLSAGWTTVSAARAAAVGGVRARVRTPAVVRRVAAPLAVPARMLDRGISAVERIPIVLRVLPPVIAVLISMVVFLYAHSPLIYSQHFAAVSPLIVSEGQNEYGAHPLRHGAWSLLYVNQSGGVTFATVAAGGHVIRQAQLAGTGSEPSLASHHGWALGVWVNGAQSNVMAAYLGNHHSRSFSLLPGGGQVDHPYVTLAPGGFDVLFQWQPSSKQKAEYQIYLAYLRNGQTHPSAIRLIGATPDYGLFPRGIVDGSGKLDVYYLDRYEINNWYWRFQRFTPQGVPVSRRRTISTMYYVGMPRTNPPPSVVPSQWGIDLKRGRDGSVWVVWEGGPNAADFLFLQRWSRSGHQIVPPTQLPVGCESGATSAISLALLPHGGQLYCSGQNPNGGVSSVIFMQAFNASGNLVGAQQRVNYDGGGNSEIPYAGTVNKRPVVIWERVREGPAYLEASSYHADASKPTLLTRLGLNIGNLWVNIGLVLAGALAGGVAVAIVNIFLLLLLVALWLPIGWLAPRSIRWLLYAIAIAIVIIEVFSVHASSLPNWIIVISGLGSPENWVAVGVAIFASIWAGLFLFRRYEAIFRAAAMAYVSVYVLAVMYGVIFIQSEITRI